MSADVSNRSVGDRVGRFVLLQQLGGGTSGTVYLAEDTMLGDKVALKLLNPDVREVGLERFKREILLARRIVHPGVCRVFDLHEEDGALFQTMEYIPGETLEAVLQAEGRLDLNRAIRTVRDVADAVAAAHATGVLHRDLKPANIILGLGRKPTVVDFGCAIADSVGRVTQVGRLVGTVRYLAPEVLTQTEEASERSDVYALGVILYRCLCGQPASPGNTLEEVVQQAKAGPPPPSFRNPEISRALDQATLRSVAPDPQERFQTAAELARALDGLIEDTKPKITVPRVDPAAPWDGDIELTVTSVVDFLSDSDVFRQKLRYTTILFSDIVGITEFFSAHGDLEGCRRIKKHNDLLFEEIESFGGTVIKTIGDAIMASFSSPYDGVSAAVAMQRTIAQYNLDAPIIEEPILIRIGVNSGEAVIQGRDAFGDTVNVAARISSRAAAEQILISAETYEAVRERDLPIRNHARVTLKGKGDQAFTLYRVEWKSPEEDTGEILIAKEAESTPPFRHDAPTAKNPALPAFEDYDDQDTELTLMPPESEEPTDPNGPPKVVGPTPERSSTSESVTRSQIGQVPHGSRKVRVQQWGLVAPAGDILPPPGSGGRRRNTGEGKPSGRRNSGPISKTFAQRAREARRARSQAPDRTDARTSKERCDALVAEIEATLAERGIIRGDAEAVDKLMDTAARLLRQKRQNQAVRFLELAHGRVLETAVDDAFVAAKISRLRRQATRKGDPVLGRTLGRLGQASQLASAGRYPEANRILNEGFDDLD